MASRRHYKRNRETPDIDVTTFLNLMVVLIPFLLVTAVFSRITIQELNMPEAAGGAQVDKPLVTIEVIVRKNALEVGDGRSVALSIPKGEEGYNFAPLSAFLIKLKGQYPEKEDATLLVEPDVEYEDVIHVMDAVKIAELSPEVRREAGLEVDAEQGNGTGETQKMVLFPVISIGDAP